MNRRCVRCKCIQFETSFKFHERTCKDLDAPFYCKRCYKKKDEPIDHNAIQQKKKLRHLKFLEKKMVQVQKQKTENGRMFRLSYQFKENYLIPRQVLVNMVKNPF